MLVSDFFIFTVTIEKMMNINDLKKLAAEKAVEEIKDGMVIGLGTGSTFQFALEKIAARIKEGDLKNIVGVCSSERTRLESLRLGIPITTLNELYQQSAVGNQKSEVSDQQSDDHSQFSTSLPAGKVLNSQLLIDVTIDGADEVDEHLNLIKGGGGALLGEKIIVQATKKFIVIVDEGKLSKTLGTNFAVPVEVLKKAEDVEKKYLQSLGAAVTKRMNNNDEYITDEGNIILDAKFNSISNVDELSSLMNKRAGIVEHGIFENNFVAKVISAMKDGTIKEIAH